MSNVPTLSDLRMTHDPAGRGYHAVYRENAVNRCPGCGRSHWIIGRLLAECGQAVTLQADHLTTGWPGGPQFRVWFETGEHVKEDAAEEAQIKAETVADLRAEQEEE